MALILNIETATELCSVALACNGKTVILRETTVEKSHAGSLTVFIDEVLNEHGISVRDLDAVAAGKGPGSYTGLRIGVSVAKGLCYGSGIPLLAIGTLQTMIAHALSVITDLNSEILFCPMIDARRMEVFCCIADRNGNEIEPTSAVIIETTTFEKYLEKHQIAFFGTGMEKSRNVIQHPNAIFIPGILPYATAMAQLSELSFIKNEFENVAYFEPFYLKDFIATVSKKSLHF